MTFHDFSYLQKMIMGNRISVAVDEMLEYIIESIPDIALSD